MKSSALKFQLITAIVVYSSVSATTARAGTLFSQPYAGSPFAAVSQIFPQDDFPAGSTLSFDDFNVTTPGWIIQGVTAYGLEQADPTLNRGVFLQIQSTSLPSFFDTTDPIYKGTEDASGNLNFTGLNIVLGPGTYWLTAWVERPVAGGNWLWNYTDDGNPNGSEFMIENPGGQYPGNLFGYTTLETGSTFFLTPPSDLALTITGGLVPEPSSLVLLAIGGAIGLGVCLASRFKQSPPVLEPRRSSAEPSLFGVLGNLVRIVCLTLPVGRDRH
jgi:hypothetical protein